MLNNTNIEDLNESTKKIMKLETGLPIEEIFEDYGDVIVDTRDTLEDFKKSFSEHQIRETQFQGTKYFSGQIQKAKGMAREKFVFVPEKDGFNIVLIY